MKSQVGFFDRIIIRDSIQLEKLNRHPIRNLLAIRKTSKSITALKARQIQAINEGEHDILTPAATQPTGTTDSVVDKNNYQTYTKQVTGAYQMYAALTDYGGELLGSLIDTRVAFIAGESVSIISGSPKTKEYADKFLTMNKMKGSRLLSMVQTGELEGKNLVVLLKKIKLSGENVDKEKSFIAARSFSWYANNYEITYNPRDTDEITKIAYKPKNETNEEKTIPATESVFVKLGGSEYQVAETTHKIHRCLTQIENASRAEFDLRKNSHLFGRQTPTWKFDPNDPNAELGITSINNAVQGNNWDVGQGYAGRAEFGYKAPGTGAQELILADFLTNIRIISINTGIPVHWLSWPELMSNRATAENILESVNAATKKERLIWEESIKEMIQKSMAMAIDNGIEDNSIIGEFEVRIPLTTMATLKMITDVWVPLVGTYISEATLRNMLPGIDPLFEEKMLKKEAKKRAEESPMQNQTTNGMLRQQQNNAEGEEVENE